MNLVQHTLSTAWLCGGAALFAWTAMELLEAWRSEYRSFGATTASLIFVVFALVAVLGGVLGVRGNNLASPTLITLSWVGLLYTTAYVLLGGFDDTGVSYAVCVLALAVLSVATLLGRRVLRKPRASPEWPAS